MKLMQMLNTTQVNLEKKCTLEFDFYMFVVTINRQGLNIILPTICNKKKYL